jgi:hypothetical protein
MIVLAESIVVWAALGKVSLILGVVVALTRIVTWLRAPREKLICKVRNTSFSVPPKILDDIDSVFDTAKAEHSVLEGAANQQEARGARYAISDLKHKIKFGPVSQLTSFSGAWYATVENRGKKKCTGVSISLPGATLLAVKRGGGGIAMQQASTQFELGHLRPSETLELTGWTNWPVGLLELSSVKLTHDSGSGSVKPEFPGNRLSYLIVNKPFEVIYLLFMAALLLLALAYVGLVIYAKSQPPRPPLEPTNSSSALTSPSPVPQ